MEQTSPRKACDAAEDPCTSNGDNFDDHDVFEIVNDYLTNTTATPSPNTSVPDDINFNTLVPTDPLVDQNHPRNTTIHPFMNGVIDSEQNTNVPATHQPNPLFATRFVDDKSIATPDPFSETANNEADIDNISSDILPSGEEMLNMENITDNDIQEFHNWISSGYQKDAIPFSSMNRCKRLIIIFV